MGRTLSTPYDSRQTARLRTCLPYCLPACLYRSYVLRFRNLLPLYYLVLMLLMKFDNEKEEFFPMAPTAHNQ